MAYEIIRVVANIAQIVAGVVLIAVVIRKSAGRIAFVCIKRKDISPEPGRRLGK